MEDNQIIDLYFARSEDAITHTAEKYGAYCHHIAYNILYNEEDSEECVNDTYLKAWGIIPPRRPKLLSTFLGKLTRNLSLDRYRYYNADKRRASGLTVALDELSDCVSDGGTEDERIEEMMLTQLLNGFLAGLAPTHRKIFMRRYWYLSSIEEIAEEYGYTQSKVKMSLQRSRNQLKALLEKEGVTL